MAGAAWLVEDAVDERDLYRTIAGLDGATEERIARVASRYGLLGRAAARAATRATPALALWFAAERDRLAEVARSEAGTPDRAGNLPALEDRRFLDELVVAFEGLLDQVLQQAAALLEMDQHDLDALAERFLALLAARDTAHPNLVHGALEAGQDIAERHRDDGDAPAWVGILSALPASTVAAFDGLLGDIGHAWRRGDLTTLGQQLNTLSRMIAPPVTGRSPGLIDAAPLMAPLLTNAAGTDPSRRPKARPAKGGLRQFLGIAIAQLLAWWSTEDTPVAEGRHSAFPRLDEPATVRTVFLLLPVRSGPAMEDLQGLFDLRRQDRITDWRQLAKESVAWMEAIDALASAPSGREQLPGWRARMRSLVERIESDLMNGTDGRRADPVPEVELRSVMRVRARLLRLLAQRLHAAGFPVLPPDGVLGTEARTLISIDRALRSGAPARLCSWPGGCSETLPPGSHGNRRYCDAHRGEAARLRVARNRD
ncbi:MAG: hypothetical protein KGJ98_13970 [Chloroflexota bacterium]|nr:hypothetical protein [Chloroflexota bacterium]